MGRRRSPRALEPVEPTHFVAHRGEAPWTVTVEERASKRGTLYLRWRPPGKGNWRWESLRRTLPLHPERARRAAMDWARAQAQAKYEALTGCIAPSETSLLAVADTWAIVSSPAGLVPTRSRYREEVERALRIAAGYLRQRATPITLWTQVTKHALHELAVHVVEDVRRRKGTAGLRSAEVTIERLLQVAKWLRDADLIPSTAGHAMEDWKGRLVRYVRGLSADGELAAPARERYTEAEIARLFAKAAAGDPRMHLLAILGAELRPAQVARVRRSHLQLMQGTSGALEVKGRGRKGGELVVLTVGMRAVLDAALHTGYLREAEAAFGRGELRDYWLFPAGRLRGTRAAAGPYVTPAQAAKAAIDRKRTQDWWRIIERAAGVPYVPGRGIYGVRRGAVDAAIAAGVDDALLQRLGGWKSSVMPKDVYADATLDPARVEAAQLKAKLRGESSQAQSNSEDGVECGS